jgi:hypothetical protein
MPDKYDAYRDALVMETKTIWPAGLRPTDEARRQRIEAALHADPERVSILDYIRVHTGFCRQITVTAEDIERVES